MLNCHNILSGWALAAKGAAISLYSVRRSPDETYVRPEEWLALSDFLWHGICVYPSREVPRFMNLFHAARGIQWPAACMTG